MTINLHLKKFFLKIKLFIIKTWKDFLLKYIGFYGSRKISTHQTPPWKLPPQKIPTWNIRTHFINCLSSLNTASINGGWVYMYILLPGQKFLISAGRFKVFSWNFGNINKIFIKNIFSVLSLKYEVPAHDQIAISQYHP